MPVARSIAETDRKGALPAVVVNKSFAEKTWPNESAIGKRIKLGDDEWRTVIGVVGDARHFSLDERQFYPRQPLQRQEQSSS